MNAISLEQHFKIEFSKVEITGTKKKKAKALKENIEKAFPSTNLGNSLGYSLQKPQSETEKALKENPDEISKSEEYFSVLFPYVVTNEKIEEKIKSFYTNLGYDFQGKILEQNEPCLRFADKEQNIKIIYSKMNRYLRIKVFEEYQEKTK